MSTEKKYFSPFYLPLLQETFLIEANAGTGKTYNIELLILRIIIEKSLTMDKILTLTFTNNAVNELKERIYKRISNTLNFLQNTKNTLDQETQKYLATFSNKTKIISTLQYALSKYNDAPIQTIDSFAFRTCNEFFTDIATSSELQIDQEQYQLSKEKCKHDFWWTNAQHSNEEYAYYFLFLYKKPSLCFKDVETIYNRRFHISLPNENNETSYNTFIQIKNLFYELKKNWDNEKEDIHKNFNNFYKGARKDWLLKIENFIQQNTFFPPVLIPVDTLQKIFSTAIVSEWKFFCNFQTLNNLTKKISLLWTLEAFFFFTTANVCTTTTK